MRTFRYYDEEHDDEIANIISELREETDKVGLEAGYGSGFRYSSEDVEEDVSQ